MSASASNFVPRDERERLMALFAIRAYERGYAHTGFSDAAQAARLPASVFRTRWASEEECAGELLDLCVEQTFSVVAERYMGTGGDAALAAHQALGAFLTHVSGMPEVLHLGVVDYPDVSLEARRRTSGYIELFAEFLGPAISERGLESADPTVAAQFIGGGIFGVLRQHALTGRIDELPATLPAISYVCLSTFFGADEARRILRLAEVGGR